MQRAMLVRIAREGPQTVASKTEARTASSLRSRELLRPGYPRQDGRDAQGRWYLTAKGRRLIAERGALEAATPSLIPENGGGAGIRFRERKV